MTAERDPLSIFYDALCDVLEAAPEFSALVKPGNFIRFSGRNRAPIKDEISTADVPEVRIVPVAGTPLEQISSSSVQITRVLAVQCSSGDQRVTEVTYPLQWAIMVAILRAQPELEALTWRGHNFVVRVTAPSENIGIDQADLDRGVMGWSVIINIDVQMIFPRNMLEILD